MASPLPPLTLTEKKSSLDGMTMIEQVPRKRIKALLKSGKLLEKWDVANNFAHQMASKLYENEKDQLTKYLKKWNRKLGGVPVMYSKSQGNTKKAKWGRVFPLKSLGLTTISRFTRNTLIRGLYYDFDLKNAQMQILWCLCKSNSNGIQIDCEMLEDYCMNRKKWLDEIQEEYGVSKDVAKKLILRLSFCGKFEMWCADNKVEKKTPLKKIQKLEKELGEIAKTLSKHNTTLYETARKAKEESGTSKNVMGAFLSRYLQEYELRIMEDTMNWLMNKTEVFDKGAFKVGTYEYDGMKLCCELVDKIGVEQLLLMLNNKCKEITGFDLTWELKDMGNEYYEIEEPEEDDEDALAEKLEDLKYKINANVGDRGYVEIIMAEKKDQFIYSISKDGDGEKGEWYCWNGTRWERGHHLLKDALMDFIPKYYDELLLPFIKIDMMDEEEAKLFKEIEDLVERKKYAINNNTSLNNIVGVAKTMLRNYNLEFDTKAHLFGCENGVIDMEEECFRPYRYDDFVAMSCGFDFTALQAGFKVIDKEGNVKLVDSVDEDQKTYFADIITILGQIFPDEDVRNYVMKIFASGMYGRLLEKFFIFNGEGRNGKGLMDTFMKHTLGDYCLKTTHSVFTENQKNKDTKSASPVFAMLEKKRYVYCEEPPKNSYLQNAIVKELTGGGKYMCRKLNQDAKEIILMATFIMECNSKPNLAEEGQVADAERIRDILYPSRFTTEDEEVDETKHIYKVNVELKTDEWYSKHRNAFLNMLLQNVLMLKNDAKMNIDYYLPESVKQRSNAYIQNSLSIHKIFIELFEKRNEAHKEQYVNWKREPEDADWSISKIAQHIRKSSEFYDLPRKTKEEQTNKKVEEFFQTNKLYKVDCYNDTHSHTFKMKDWRLKPASLDEDE